MRTTIKDLEYFVSVINEKIGVKEYGIGHYMLGQAYGRVRLELVVNSGGGITIPEGFTHGFGTKRELESQLRAFIAGLSVKA